MANKKPYRYAEYLIQKPLKKQINQQNMGIFHSGSLTPEGRYSMTVPIDTYE